MRKFIFASLLAVTASFGLGGVATADEEGVYIPPDDQQYASEDQPPAITYGYNEDRGNGDELSPYQLQLIEQERARQWAREHRDDNRYNQDDEE